MISPLLTIQRYHWQTFRVLMKEKHCSAPPLLLLPGLKDRLRDRYTLPSLRISCQVLIEWYQDNVLADELTLAMSDLVPLVKDPICGMRVSPKTAAYAYKDKKGEIHYFCAEGCLKKFKTQKKIAS